MYRAIVDSLEITMLVGLLEEIHHLRTGGFRKIYKLDYSNDVRTLSRGSIITTRNQHGQCGNLNYAWLTGGYVTTPTTPTRTSNIERLDYANDSTTSNRGTGPICFNHLCYRKCKLWLDLCCWEYSG